MPSSEKEKLLDDLLRDPNYEAFRAEVRALSMAEFRASRRRYSAPARLALAASIAASIVVAAVLTAKFRHGEEAPSKTAVSAGAVQRDQVSIIPRVETVPLETTEVIRSVPDRALVVETGRHGKESFETFYSSRTTVSEVNDAQLLALFPDDSLGIVQTPRGKRLVLFAETARR